MFFNFVSNLKKTTAMHNARAEESQKKDKTPDCREPRKLAEKTKEFGEKFQQKHLIKLFENIAKDKQTTSQNE